MTHFVKIGSDTWEIDTRYQGPYKVLGAGAYGTVISALDTKQNRKIAIKKITNVFRDLTDAKRILRELALLKTIKGHENLIWILDAFVGPPTKDFKDVYIVTDLLDTDLGRIIESPQPLSDSHVKFFTYQLFRGLKYLHTAGILHRDLKPQNCLVKASCECIIADLGLARPVEGLAATPEDDEGEDAKAAPVAPAGGSGEDLTAYVVTRWYRPPELLCQVKSYDQAVDIWSMGCILAELLGRRVLFPGRHYAHQLQIIIEHIGSPTDDQLGWLKAQNPSALRHIKALAGRRKISWSKLFPSANPLALDLLDKLLQFDPSKRLTVTEALAHPYLADYHLEDDEPSARAPDPAEWEFDRRPEGAKPLTKQELQALMMREVHHFRGHQGDRPSSMRMATHTASLPLFKEPAPSGGGAGKGAVAAYLAPTKPGGPTEAPPSNNLPPKAVAAPPPSGAPPLPAAAPGAPPARPPQQVGLVRRASAPNIPAVMGIGAAAASRLFAPLGQNPAAANAASAALPGPAAVKASDRPSFTEPRPGIPQRPAPTVAAAAPLPAPAPASSILTGAYKPAPVPAEAHKPAAAGAGRSPPEAAAAPAPAPASDVSIIVAALMDQLKTLKLDVLAAVDNRMGELQSSIADQVKQAMKSIEARVAQLESSQKRN